MFGRPRYGRNVRHAASDAVGIEPYRVTEEGELLFGEEQWGISLSEGGQDFIQVADRQADSAPGLPYLRETG